MRSHFDGDPTAVFGRVLCGSRLVFFLGGFVANPQLVLWLTLLTRLRMASVWCQPLGLFTHHEPRRSYCFEAFIHGIETHFPGLAAHNLGGDIDRSTKRRNLILPCAEEWDPVLAAAQTHHAGGSLFTPYWRSRTQRGHGSRLDRGGRGRSR